MTDAAFETEVEAAIGDAVPGRAGDVAGLLRRAERQASVEALPPIGNPRPPVRLAKQLVRRATVGPLTHLAAQVGALGATLAAASSALEARVNRLEQRTRRVDALPAGAAAARRRARRAGGPPCSRRPAPMGCRSCTSAPAMAGCWCASRPLVCPAGASSRTPVSVLAARRAVLDVRLDPPRCPRSGDARLRRCRGARPGGRRPHGRRSGHAGAQRPLPCWRRMAPSPRPRSSRAPSPERSRCFATSPLAARCSWPPGPTCWVWPGSGQCR